MGAEYEIKIGSETFCADEELIDILYRFVCLSEAKKRIEADLLLGGTGKT